MGTSPQSSSGLRLLFPERFLVHPSALFIVFNFYAEVQNILFFIILPAEASS